jgi:hypothetical protein
LSEEPTESQLQPKDALIKAIEEDTARYGQICLWLRNMANWSKNEKEKAHFRLLLKFAITEFYNVTCSINLIKKEIDKESMKEAKEIIDDIVVQKGRNFNALFREDR